MSDDKPHDQIADDAEGEADDLEARGEEVSEHIEETKKEWESNRQDDAVPGANPPELDD
jgi:hypothetical protein